MKIRKTLVFMFKNPTPIFLYFLFCWILFSALITTADDPFQYGTLPDAADEIKKVGEGLPWSLWKLCTALTLMIEEIARDMSYEGFWFMIIPALLVGYLEARGSVNGIEKKRKEWMNWYNDQTREKESGEFGGTPQFPEKVPDTAIPRGSSITDQSILYFPKQLLIHFLYWITAFAILAIVTYLTDGKQESIRHLVMDFGEFLIPSAVLSLLSSYRSSRGYVKGINAEQGEWTNWYKLQAELIADGEKLGAPPSSVRNVSYSKYKTVIDAVVFILRNPRHLLFHFAAWIFASLLILFVLAGIYGGLTHFPPVEDIVWLLLGFLSVPAAIFTIIINYRAARGNLTGMKLEQEVWNRWYTQQQETQENLPISGTIQSESYLMNVKKTLISIARKPQLFLIHFICWIAGFILVYGVTDLLALEALPDFAQIILVFLLTLISSFQEIKGNHNGRNNQRQTWMDWWDQQQNDTEKDAQFAQPSPILEVY